MADEFVPLPGVKTADVAMLCVQEEEMGDAFFGALERVREIHANCRALLRTHHQRAGLELMDSMAAHQESAYERLCRSTSHTILDCPPNLHCKPIYIYSYICFMYICFRLHPLAAKQ